MRRSVCHARGVVNFLLRPHFALGYRGRVALSLHVVAYTSSVTLRPTLSRLHLVAHFVDYTSSHASSATLRRPHFVPDVVPRLVDCTCVKGFDSPASYSNMWGQFCVTGSLLTPDSYPLTPDS